MAFCHLSGPEVTWAHLSPPFLISSYTSFSLLFLSLLVFFRTKHQITPFLMEMTPLQGLTSDTCKLWSPTSTTRNSHQILLTRHFSPAEEFWCKQLK